MDGEVLYDNSTYTISFVPNYELNYSTTYKLELINNFMDLQGNRLEQNYTWIFITGLPEEEIAGRYNTALLFVTFAVIIILIIFSILIGTGKVDIIKLSKSFSKRTSGKKDRKLKPSEQKQRIIAAEERTVVRRKKKRRGFMEDEDYFDEQDDFPDDDFLDWSEEELYRSDKKDFNFDEIDEDDEDYSVDWENR
jgi:hypothetical protein